MNVLYAYNFVPQDIEHGDFDALYEQRRRDSIFAFAYEKDGAIYALRDHLGIAPLYYRYLADEVRFASNLSDLVQPGDELDHDGLVTYLKFGTARLVPLIKNIHIVPAGSVVKIDPVSHTVQTVYTYCLRPRHISVFTSMSQLTDEFEALLVQAIQRLIRQDPVGLYLSGGIDSALIGIYLRKAGIEVHGFTSAAWGKTSSEIAYAEINARLIPTARHVIDYLETDAYSSLLEELPHLFGVPHGTTTALGVASLWKNSAIAEERQIFFGQNSDTVMACVPAQYVTYFMQYMPGVVRKKLHPTFKHSTLIANYLSFTRDFPPDTSHFLVPPLSETLTNVQKLIVMGMSIVHTPTDGEVLAQPAINRGILVADPYYDIDLVEFCLGIPLSHRVGVARKTQTWFHFEKHLLQRLALRYLPKGLVFRKKAFTVSFERDERSQALAQALPHMMLDIPLADINERFAAASLIRWAAVTGLFHGGANGER